MIVTEYIQQLPIKLHVKNFCLLNIFSFALFYFRTVQFYKTKTLLRKTFSIYLHLLILKKKKMVSKGISKISFVDNLS